MIQRRDFLRGLSSAGATAVFGTFTERAAAEPPPETTRIRLAATSTLCFAPQFVAEELLRAEGFADVQYVNRKEEVASGPLLAAGEADLSFGLAANLMLHVDRDEPVVFLAGGHAGCYELFAGSRIRTLRDLRGGTVAVPRLGGGSHTFLVMMLASVGLDPRKDVQWKTPKWEETKRLLASDGVDAFLGFPPEPQELRARKIGRLILDTAKDRPWSQYFCCMLGGNREFVRRHPIATKRAVRAILKATELCGADPERAAGILARDAGKRSEYTAQLVRELPYARWRDFDPEDSLRFFALRLREAGMVKSTPQKILAQGTDWRFLNELKRELKG